MPSTLPSLLRRTCTALAVVGLAACVNYASGAPEPVTIPATPVIGRVDVPPELAARRIKGALFGHADLKPRRTDYEPEFQRPGLGHPALARFSLYEERGSMVDSVDHPTDGFSLSEKMAEEKAGPQDDPAYAAYLDLPAAQRRLDLVIAVQTQATWAVPEYQTNGRPARYNSGYIVHFTPAATGSGTDIQVIGSGSRVKTGASWHKKRGGDGLGLPYIYGDDMQFVVPSLADRQALLGVMTRLAVSEPPP